MPVYVLTSNYRHKVTYDFANNAWFIFIRNKLIRVVPIFGRLLPPNSLQSKLQCRNRIVPHQSKLFRFQTRQTLLHKDRLIVEHLIVLELKYGRFVVKENALHIPLLLLDYLEIVEDNY